MAENKKISELELIPHSDFLSATDEFVFVDKSIISGPDASASGRTSRVTLEKLTASVLAVGNPGADGEKGDKGDAGADGATGSQGQKGEMGATGSQGQKGDTGATGGTGSQGQKGHPGATGSTGSQGQKGHPGATGSTGSQGQKGQKGQGGATGSTGSQGLKGNTGATGASGSPWGGGTFSDDVVFGGGGDVWLQPSDNSNPNLMFNRYYSDSTKSFNGFTMTQGSFYEHFRMWSMDNSGDGHLASCIDSTSLYFRNNDKYPAIANSVGRNWKAAIDPKGNFVCVGYMADNHSFSDKTLKKDIERIESSDALDKVSQLSAVTFKWIEKDDDETHIGLIAQEVQEIVPEVVEERNRLQPGNDEPLENQPNKLYVEYDKLVPLLIESVKELKNKISELESKIN